MIDIKLDMTAARDLVARALAEDLGWGDVTTNALVAPDQMARARVVVKNDGVLAGIDVAALVFKAVDAASQIEILARDGASISVGENVALVVGPARGILSGERVALNFLQRLSGIATTTSRYVEAVKGTKARIVDTRKTVPGLRVLEKYAVRAGGGHNHRFGLSDGVLIKDNHLVAARGRGLGLGDAVAMARGSVAHTMRVEVEVESLAEVDEAVEAGADAILLDNMHPATMREAVRRIGGRALVEASGGITMETVRAAAEAGVDIISVGALTHSVKALDISLDFEL